MMTGNLCTCGTTLGRNNKSGRCRRCVAAILNSDPAMIAKRRAAQIEFFAKPETKAALAERARKLAANMTDEDRENRRAHGHRMARTVLNRPDVIAITLAPETRARAGRSRTETTLAWCPPEFRDQYRDLCKRGNRAPKARRIVEERIALAALAPAVQRWHADRAMFGRSAPAIRVRSVAPAPTRKLIDLSAVPSSMEKRYAGGRGK